jgi:hypothetical protein
LAIEVTVTELYGYDAALEEILSRLACDVSVPVAQ